MALHEFVKPHRRTPAEDTLARRAGDRAWLVAVVLSNLLWTVIEDGVVDLAARHRRRRLGR